MSYRHQFEHATSDNEAKNISPKLPHPSVSVTNVDNKTMGITSDEIFEEQANKADLKSNQISETQKSKNRSFRDRFFSKKNKNPAIRLNGEYEHNLAEYLLTPTHPKHLGIFQFMPFEHQELDDNISFQGDDKKEEHAPLTTKEKLRHILHSKALHLIIILLVLFDSVLVIFELLFDLEAFGEENKDHIVREIFHGFSIGILSMFMIELILKLWADHQHFIRHKIEVLDAVVVVISWILDIALVFFDSTSVLALELILLLRLWRVFRIVNGLIVAVKTKADERVHLFKMENKKLQTKLNEANEKINVLKNDVQILKTKLAECGVKIEENMI